MKKIILSKIVHTNPSPDIGQQDADQDASSSSKETEVPFQPPLPIGPPPPDSPTRIQIKKEILEDEYPDDTEYKVQIPIFDVKCKQEVAPVEPRPMCKRFARGTCTNGSACIFRHEIDVSQLRSLKIYKFCWDFQNKKCTRPVCKHVHASIFEEQHYYRTGYLPPSALAHHKPENFAAKDNVSGNSQVVKAPSHDGKLQILSPIYEETQNESQIKRLWDKNNHVGSAQPVFAPGQPRTKKCKKCDEKEISMEEANNKMKAVLRSIVRLKEGTGEITEKSKRLYQAIQTIMLMNSVLSNNKDNRNQIFQPGGKDMLSFIADMIEVAKLNDMVSPEQPPQ